MPIPRQIHGLFVLMLLSTLPACQGRSEKTTTREAGGDRSTVYTRTQGPPPGGGGQTGADSSTPTPAEGGAVGTPGPSRPSPTGTTHGATAPSSDTAGRPATAPTGEPAGRGTRPSGDMNRERR